MELQLSVQGVAGGLDLGASHGIGHILGGSAGMPHGETSCVMLPHVLAYNFSVTAKRQGELSQQIEGRESYMKQLVDWLVYLGTHSFKGLQHPEKFITQFGAGMPQR